MVLTSGYGMPTQCQAPGSMSLEFRAITLYSGSHSKLKGIDEVTVRWVLSP